VKGDGHFTNSIYYPSMLIVELKGMLNLNNTISAALSLSSNSEFWGTNHISYNHSLDINASVVIRL
jgi:hypothetical protein